MLFSVFQLGGVLPQKQYPGELLHHELHLANFVTGKTA